jgi:hypothetical protein
MKFSVSFKGTIRLRTRPKYTENTKEKYLQNLRILKKDERQSGVFQEIMREKITYRPKRIIRINNIGIRITVIVKATPKITRPIFINRLYLSAHPSP